MRASCILVCFLMFLAASSALPGKKKQYKPCRELVLYFHDIIYNGQNAANATSAIVAAPEGANLTILAGQFHFGNIAVFDDPITLDNNLHSPPVGRAQGMYIYDTKNTFTAWLGFSFSLNSTDHLGTINFLGADPIMIKTRDISVVGGTRDFLCTGELLLYPPTHLKAKFISGSELTSNSINVGKKYHTCENLGYAFAV